MARYRDGIAAYAIAYFVVTSLTIGISRYQEGLALVWFGTAVGVCCLINIDRRLWGRAILALGCASALATSLFGFGPHMALPLAIANVFEAWLAASLLLVARPQRDWLETVRGLVVLLVVCGLIAPAAAGLPGAVAASFAAPGGVMYHFTAWVPAHALGSLIAFPIVQIIAGAEQDETTPAGPLEYALHALAITFVSMVSFGDHRLPLLFLPIVPLLLAAFRCGHAGGAIGVLIIGSLEMMNFDPGASAVSALPFETRGRLVFMQFYLATLTLLAIICSVAMHKHRLVLREMTYRKAIKQLIAENSDDALVNLDEDGMIRFASPAGQRFTGRDDLVGRHLDVFFDPIDGDSIADALDRARVNPNETVVFERHVLNAEGERWLEAKLRTASSTVDDLTLHGFAVTIRDVTERKHTELDAIHASETDALTDLPNRRVFLREFEAVLPRAAQRPLAFAIVDLDFFKAINDIHGHAVGDDVLRAVARVMHRFTTTTRTFARLGGEEFALIDKQPDFAVSQALCEDLRRAIAALMPRTPDGQRLPITASIGLSRIDRPIGVTEAMQATDLLLYRAKSKGRNRVEIAAPARTFRTHRCAA